MKNKFNIGDRVVGVENAGAKIKGKEGRVIGVGGNTVTVEFDEDVNGHNGSLSGNTGKEGHCWHCKPEHLKVLQKNCVIFSKKTTILIKDGKKYVSKCMDGDTYDKEKGLLLCLAQANGISYKDLQEMIAGAKDCNAEKAKELAGKIATGIVAAVKAFKTALNGEKADDKAQVREVKRPAKEGEYIKIVKAEEDEPYKNGDIFKVIHSWADGDVRAYCDGIGNTSNEGYNFIFLEEYVVLENYTPYKITLSEFWKKGKIRAIHCKTQKEAKTLLKAFNSIGEEWRDGCSYLGETYFTKYGNKTIYDNTNGFADVGGTFHTERCEELYEFNEVDLEH